jgi:hypothetical protein
MQYFNDDEGEVVYICTARAEPVVFSDDKITHKIPDTESVSDSVSTFVDSASNSRQMRDIPDGITALDLLLILPGDIWLEIFKNRMLEEAPDWVPPTLSITNTNREIYHLDDRVLPDVKLQLLEMGYISDDKYLDSKWIQRLTVQHLNNLEDMTGYHIPPPAM